MNIVLRRTLMILGSIAVLAMITDELLGSILLAATFWVPGIIAELILTPLLRPFDRHC